MEAVTVSSYLFLILNLLKSSSGTSQLMMMRAGPCFNIPETIVTVSEMVVDNKRHETFMTGQMNISEDVENGWSIRATMLKCHDIRNLDTCDFYKSASIVKDGCTTDNDGENGHTVFFSYFQPKLSCPIKAGSYEFTNFPFLRDESDTTGESKISTSVFGYTYRLEGFDDNYEKIMCVEAYLQPKYDRNHNWFGERLPEVENSQTDDTLDQDGEEDGHHKHEEDE